MPEVVKADHRQTFGVLSDSVTPTLRGALGRDLRAVDLTEHEVTVTPACAYREAAFELGLAVRLEEFDEWLVEFDATAAGGTTGAFIWNASPTAGMQFGQ